MQGEKAAHSSTRAARASYLECKGAADDAGGLCRATEGQKGTAHTVEHVSSAGFAHIHQGLGSECGLGSSCGAGARCLARSAANRLRHGSLQRGCRQRRFLAITAAACGTATCGRPHQCPKASKYSTMLPFGLQQAGALQHHRNELCAADSQCR